MLLEKSIENLIINININNYISDSGRPLLTKSKKHRNIYIDRFLFEIEMVENNVTRNFTEEK